MRFLVLSVLVLCVGCQDSSDLSVGQVKDSVPTTNKLRMSEEISPNYFQSPIENAIETYFWHQEERRFEDGLPKLTNLQKWKEVKRLPASVNKGEILEGYDSTILDGQKIVFEVVFSDEEGIQRTKDITILFLRTKSTIKKTGAVFDGWGAYRGNFGSELN